MLVALVLNVFLVRSTYASIKAVVDSTEKKCVLEEQYFRVITRKYNASIFLLQVSPLFAIIYSRWRQRLAPLFSTMEDTGDTEVNSHFIYYCCSVNFEWHFFFMQS